MSVRQLIQIVHSLGFEHDNTEYMAGLVSTKLIKL